MSEQEQKPAWSEDSEAVLVAVRSQLDELPSYEHKMNVIINAMRYVMVREAKDQVIEVTGSNCIELPHLILALEMLVKEFIEQFETMPKRLKDVVTAETGCGVCDVCKQAKRDAYGDGKAIPHPRKNESREAVEKLIATMMGGKPN